MLEELKGDTGDRGYKRDRGHRGDAASMASMALMACLAFIALPLSYLLPYPRSQVRSRKRKVSVSARTLNSIMLSPLFQFEAPALGAGTYYCRNHAAMACGMVIHVAREWCENNGACTAIRGGSSELERGCCRSATAGLSGEQPLCRGDLLHDTRAAGAASDRAPLHRRLGVA
jgi:hypothetical protein